MVELREVTGTHSGSINTGSGRRKKSRASVTCRSNKKSQGSAGCRAKQREYERASNGTKVHGTPLGPVPLTFAPAKLLFQKYQVHEKIGSGSYGTVWRCTDKETEEEVACKQVEKKQGMHSILTEIDCLTRAQGCEHILKLHAVYESELYVYIVTERCNGGDLFDLLQNGELDEESAKALFGQIAEAVNHCHRRGVLHRDIKPENVLLTTEPDTGVMSARLADFGLACRLRPGEKATGCVGSEPYEAPEVTFEKPYAFSADIFSLGVVLFGMLSANWPNFSENRVFDPRRNFWRSGWKGVSPQAKNLLTRMLSYDPSMRPSATQILQSCWLSTHDVTDMALGQGAGPLSACGWELPILDKRDDVQARRAGRCEQDFAKKCALEELPQDIDQCDGGREAPSPVGSEFNMSWAGSGDSTQSECCPC